MTLGCTECLDRVANTELAENLGQNLAFLEERSIVSEESVEKSAFQLPESFFVEEGF